MSVPIEIRPLSMRPVVGEVAMRLFRELRRRAPVSLVPLGSASARKAFPVFVEAASLIRPLASVRWPVSVPDSRWAHATRLACTTAVWESCGAFESWRASAEPLPRPRAGAPDPSRPWVFLARDSGISSARLRRVAALPPGYQLQLLGPRRRPEADAVVWPRSPKAIAQLLGRCSAVVAPSGPLAWDALRLGIPVLDPREALAPLALPDTCPRLAGIFPRTLVTHGGFVEHLAEQILAARRGRPSAPPCDATWLGETATLETPLLPSLPLTIEPILRKARKLRRDPRRFFADSRHRPLRLLAHAADGVAGLPPFAEGLWREG